MAAVLFTTVDAHAWTVPAGVTSLKIEFVGGGGGGGGGGGFELGTSGTAGRGGRTSSLVGYATSADYGRGGGGGRNFRSGGGAVRSGSPGQASSPGIPGLGRLAGSRNVDGLENYGKGGNGGAGSGGGKNGGDGGGAAYWIDENYSVTPGQELSFNVGRGGSGGSAGTVNPTAGSPGISGVIRITYDDAIELSADIGSSGGLLPTLEISDTELSVNIGSSGGLLPKLYTGRPRRLLPTQTVTLPVSGYSLQFGILKNWEVRPAPAIDFDLAPTGDSRWFQGLHIFSSGQTQARFSSIASGQSVHHGDDDLSEQVETQGQLVLQYGTNVLVLNMADGVDTTEPYDWVASSKAAAFFRAIPAAGAEITLTINGFVPVPPAADVLLNSNIGTEPGFTPKLRVLNPIELGSNIGTEPRLIPNLNVTQPAIQLRADIGTEPTLVSKLQVLNPIELGVDMGAGSGITSNIKVFNPFSLSAWESRDYSAPIVLASLRSTVAGVDITVDPVVIADGELNVVTGLMITQVERFRSGGEIRLRRSQAAGTVNFNSAFGGNNIYAKAKLIIVLEDDDDRTQIVFNQSNQGGGFSNWLIQDATQASLINGIATDDNFLLAIALPALELDVSIGSSLALAPKLNVTQPAIYLSADIGTEPRLIPNLNVTQPAIYLSTDIGTEPALVSKLQVLNPFQVTMGSGAGASPNLTVFVETLIEMNVSMGAGVGITPRLFDENAALGPVDGAGGKAGLAASLQVGKRIDVAVSIGTNIATQQNINVNIPTIIVGAKPMVAWAMEIAGIGDMKVPYRVWSGLEQLDWNGTIWDGTQNVNGAFVSVSPVTDKVGTPDRRASVTVSVNAEMTRELLAVDTGPVSVFLRYLYSLDNGLSWIEAPMALAGRLSQPKFEGGFYSVEIETWSGDADRGEPKFWSDETQRAEFPGDKGFEFVRKLSQGLDTKWPP